jgi:hypothetical protein
MSRIRATVEGETVVWKGGSRWHGFTKQGRAYADLLTELVPIERGGGDVPSITLALANRLRELASSTGVLIVVEDVEPDPGEADVPPDAVP